MMTINEAVKKIKDQVDKFASREQMGIYARDMAKLIGVRTRLGRAVMQNGATTSAMKKLSESYKKQRKGQIAFFSSGGRVIPYVPKSPPRLHTETTPSKSNLTNTGEMIDSLVGRGVSVGRGIIRLIGRRNQDIGGWQEDKGRVFMRLAKAEITRLTRQIGNDLEQFIKKSLR
jgi:hypothetical protein